MRISSLRLPATALLVLCANAAQADEPFQDLPFPSAIAAAEEADKLVLLYFHTHAGSEGTRMLRETFADENVHAWLGKHTIPLYIDADDDDKMVRRFDVTLKPATVLLRSDGRLLHRAEGFRDAPELLLDLQLTLMSTGDVKEPSGDNAEDPIAWLAWANWLFANAPDRKDECAEAYLWCLDNGDEHMAGFRARHLDFLLERISYLKLSCETALNGIFIRRDTLSRDILAGVATSTDAHEYCRFNYWLRDQYLTVDLFVELGKFDTDAHEACRRELLQHEFRRIVDNRHYEAVVALTPDPLAHVNDRLREYDKLVANGKMNTAVRARIIDDAVGLYECLLHAGKGEDARELFERVSSHTPTGRTFYAFHERAVRLELNDLARSIMAKGMGTVKSKKGKRMLELAMARIPETSELGRGTTKIPTKDDKAGGDGR